MTVHGSASTQTDRKTIPHTPHPTMGRSLSVHTCKYEHNHGSSCSFCGLWSLCQDYTHTGHRDPQWPKQQTFALCLIFVATFDEIDYPFFWKLGF